MKKLPTHLNGRRTSIARLNSDSRTYKIRFAEMYKWVVNIKGYWLEKFVR